MKWSLVPLFLAACLPAGCFTFTTTQVRVVEPSQVGLRAPGFAAGQDVIAPAGPPQTAVIGAGELLDWMQLRPFEIVAVRDDGGALRLDCEACGAAGWPRRTTGSIELMSADGTVRPTLLPAMATRDLLIVSHDSCFVQGRHGYCTVGARTELAIPWHNVARAEQVTQPSRALGVMLLSMGSFAVTGGSLLLSPAFADRSRDGGLPVRATIGVPMVALGTAALIGGLWALLSPAKHHPLRAP
jgi:hypothetical protein